MVVVEEKDRAAPQNNWKPETNSLLLGSGPKLPAAPASSNTTTTPAPRCPECGNQRVWKDGLRYTFYGEIQRYICRNCSYRFSHSDTSEPSERLQKLHTLILKSKADKTILCRVGATQTKGAKNLAIEETRIQEKAAGATTLTPETKGIIVQFAFWMAKEGHENSPYPRILKRLAKRGANLQDPESVKEVVAKHKVKDGTKLLEVYAYEALTKMLNIKWSKPHYVQEEILPFIPEERELDQIIAACKSRRMATFLQTLKETFADPGEILKLRWTDLTGNVISIRPVKGHRPRQLTISNKLVAMLNSLPRTSEKVFPTTYDSINGIFWRMKKRAANLLENPRLKAISFNTFRHWGATMVYHQTRNILLVQQLLGHKQIQSTMKYTQLVCFKEDDYEVATATSLEEDEELLKVGFQYVTERDGIKLYRKPKTFGKFMDKG